MSLICAGTMAFGLSAMNVVHAGDRETLQGRWEVSDARARLDSQPVVDESKYHGTMVFTGNKVTMQILSFGDTSVTVAFTLDTTASPRRINLAQDGGTWAGVYRIMGDSLRVALPIEHWTDHPVPPTHFGASNTMTYILRRERR